MSPEVTPDPCNDGSGLGGAVLLDSNEGNVEYNDYIERMRFLEYPMLQDAIYLDHAGTVPYSKTLMSRYTELMTTTLFGNPHSASPSSQTSTLMIDDARHKLLHFFKADPDDFDLIFVANATAGGKLVAEAFRDCSHGFTYVFHDESHTSLVGIRELARRHICLSSDKDTEDWLQQSDDSGLCLFSYPAQSNMVGRRMPKSWSHACRQKPNTETYSLLDAAALLSTASLDLSNSSTAPDFTVLSLYKIFGFPDLGALIVRKSARHIFERRKYFGGGTVDIVTLHSEQWHAKKSGPLHSQLEDGTLPIHSIAAIKPALESHAELFGGLDRISKHTAWLADTLYEGLYPLRHSNGQTVAKIYNDRRFNSYLETSTQGPILAFNLKAYDGTWISTSEVEKLASIKNIHLRSGGLCNPGGIAKHLQLAPWELRENFSAGHRCGAEDSVVNGKPTGVVRLSLGATSTLKDVETLLNFVQDFFVTTALPSTGPAWPQDIKSTDAAPERELVIENLTVYPVKSCAGHQVPADESWPIGSEGLQWDREWCIVHQGTNTVLSQKQYPRMALLRPDIDTRTGVLNIISSPTAPSSNSSEPSHVHISVPLSRDPRPFDDDTRSHLVRETLVCNDAIETMRYASADISRALSAFLGVPCQLARFPPAQRNPSDSIGSTRPVDPSTQNDTGTDHHLADNAPRHVASTRHSKSHLLRNDTPAEVRPILLSNESPILTITRASLDALNEAILRSRSNLSTTATGPQDRVVVHPSAFRANIVLSGDQGAYEEDSWGGFAITHVEQSDTRQCNDQQKQESIFEVLGPCRRCQMVCIDQTTGERQAEPFVTLAKTRRMNCVSGISDVSGDPGGPGDAGNGTTLTPAQIQSQSQTQTGTIKTGIVSEKIKSPSTRVQQGVFFGVHTALVSGMQARVKIGDAVRVIRRD